MLTPDEIEKARASLRVDRPRYADELCDMASKLPRAIDSAIRICNDYASECVARAGDSTQLNSKIMWGHKREAAQTIADRLRSLKGSQNG